MRRIRDSLVVNPEGKSIGDEHYRLECSISGSLFRVMNCSKNSIAEMLSSLIHRIANAIQGGVDSIR